MLQSLIRNIALYAMRTGALALAAFIIASWPMSSSAQDVKSYDIQRVTGSITLDGKLDEAAWGNTKEAALTERIAGDAVRLKSTVRVLWDDTALYFGFYCEDPDAWATLTEFDDPIWGEEVVEIFIDPENRQHTYYEIEVSPINTVVDLFVINNGEANNGDYKGWIPWNSKGFKSAVHVVGDGKNEGTNDKYWSVEMSFPFADMWTAENRPPKAGEMWRINCYRIERGDSKNDDDDFFAAFNPPRRRSFHTPWQFGKFYFRK